MKLFLIDGIGPFFKGYGPKRVNWSKIPFHHLETEDGLDLERFEGIQRDFRRFCEKVAALGYNAVSLDDVAHLVPHPNYPELLKRKIEQYREQFRLLFDSAARFGLQVYLTTDLMFYNSTLDEELGLDFDRITDFLSASFDGLMEDFPQLSGIILRIGESDGLDVHGDFKSRLVVRSPGQARRLIERLLPVFERHRKLLVFRTWSVGAYSIGDLIWNRSTFDRTFGGLESPSLVISMKPGESDFFRFLPLSRLFLHSDHQKIFEIQARREYEGCGEFPSFIGWDLETYRRDLEQARGVIGISVWCQTGGWTKFRRLTYVEGNSVDGSSVWNELNTEVAVDLFRRPELDVEQAVRRAFERRRPEGQDPSAQDPSAQDPSTLDSEADQLLELLRLSDEVVRELLYIDDFARQQIFFRRSRIPPLLSVYWDRVLINHSMRKLMRCFVADGEAKIRQGREALDKIRRMIELAGPLDLPVEDLEFQLQTFEFLAVAREYYFGPYDEELAQRLKKMRKRYKKKVRKPRYTLSLDFRALPVKRAHLRWIFAVMLRRKRGYRLIDQVVTVRLMGWIYPMVRRFEHRWTPKFARKQAMGVETILR